jgi:hypothetical protein
MWWGKDDPEMYYPDGRPANDSARRAARERYCSRSVDACSTLNKRLDEQHQRAVAEAPANLYLPMVKGIDSTRSRFDTRIEYEFVSAPPEDAKAQPAEGACLVCVQLKGKNKVAALSTGDPDELFIGFKLGGLSPGFICVVVGGGYFRVYTSVYDKKAEWFIGNKCLPIAGPDGIVTTGVFPADQFRAIGRVIQLPTEKDPYLGITGFAHA